MKKVDLATQPKSVEVKPVPADNNGYWWLPSSQVEISSDWENNLPTFKAGEPVNRSINVTADGIIDTQLPKISFKEVPGLKQYPEKPEISSYATPNGIVSQMTVNVVYIPEKDGVMDVPAISIPWYNINTHQMEKATLSSLQIQVENNPLLVNSDNDQVNTNNNIVTQTNENLSVSEPEETDKQNISTTQIYALFALSFVLGLIFSWMLLRGKEKKAISKTKTEPSYKKDIPSAIGKNAKDVRDIVINWARANYPGANILNLDDVENLVDDKRFSDIMAQLKKDLYSGKQQGFNSQELEKLMREHSSKKSKLLKKEQSPLPELYK